jgi:hypothetical protein
MLPTPEPPREEQAHPPQATEIQEPDQTTEKVSLGPSLPTEPERSIEPPPPPTLLEPLPGESTLPSKELHPLQKALDAFLNDRPEDAVGFLSAYDSADQELLLRLLPVLAAVARDGLKAEQMSDGEKLNLLEVLRGLTYDLRTKAPLVIDRLMFCQDVKGFGRCDPRPSNHFRPGDRVWIYGEVQNLTDRKSSDARYITRLSSTVEIRSGDRKIWSQPARSQPDWSCSPRIDHYLVLGFQIPMELEPGSYQLLVRVTDLDTSRTAEKALTFRVSSFTTAGRLP